MHSHRLLLLSSLLSTTLVAQFPAAKADDSPYRAYMDAAVEAHDFSGSVLVARGDEILFAGGFGKANRELNVDNTPSTRFRLGSITKQFTALAVLILQEQGKLSVTDPISKYVDNAPAAWDGITIHHLLTHTSGIPNFTALPDYESRKREPSPPMKTLERFRDLPLEFTPGERFNYSNSGYVLLGLILEKAGGKPYGDLLTELIFQPLGMSDTGYDHTERLLERRASGYKPGPDGTVNADYLDMSIPHAAGSLYSSVLDFQRWHRALAAGKLISPDSYAAYFRPDRDGYAYGWSIGERDGHRRQSHGGGIDGFCTEFARYPDDDLCVAVLCNDERAQPGSVASDLAAIALGLPYEVPKKLQAISLSDEAIDRLVGTYQIEGGPKLTISREGRRLQIAPEGKGPAELFAESEDRLFLRVAPVVIEVERGDDGKIASLRVLMGGNPATAKPVPNLAP